jgi:hypothetical protein
MKRVFDSVDMPASLINIQDVNLIKEIKNKRNRGEGHNDEQSLNYRNRHVFDTRIKFAVEGHLYHVDGIQIRRSVTAIKSLFTPKFDQEAALKSMFEGKSEIRVNAQGNHELVISQSKKVYNLGKNRHRILDMWEGKSDRGTEVHRLCEMYTINLGSRLSTSLSFETRKQIMFQENHDPNLEPLLVEYIKAESILAADGWYPYRVEWNIFSKKYAYAGGVDAVYARMNPNTNRYEKMVIDLKVTDKYMKEGMSRHHKNLCYPFDMYRGTYLNGFALQLNLLALPLKEEWDENVTCLKIVQLDPVDVKFRIYDCEFMIPETRRALEMVANEAEKERELNEDYRNGLLNKSTVSEWRPSFPYPNLSRTKMNSYVCKYKPEAQNTTILTETEETGDPNDDADGTT